MDDEVSLTPLEARVLAAIERHVRCEGVAPTIAELATDLRLRSRGTVHRYVQSLIGKGRLERHGNGWRGLRIVGMPVPDRPSNVHRLPVRRHGDAGPVPLHGDIGNVGTAMTIAPPPRPFGGTCDGTGSDMPRDGASLPLLGRIAAGLPIEAIEDQRFLDLSGLFAGPERYALRVSGDSMMDAGILDGDTVIVRKQHTARTGDIVVALIDAQEATLKRLGETRDGMVELIPENATMAPLRYAAGRVSFQGVLIGQLRQY